MDMLICLCVVALLLAALYAGVFQNGGLTDEGQVLANQWQTYNVHIFVNNITPATSDILANYTEATYTGYAAQAIATATIGSISGNNLPIDCAQLTYAVTGTAGTDQAYGIYITDSGNAFLIGSLLFPLGPYAMQTNGDTLKVTITEILTRI